MTALLLVALAGAVLGAAARSAWHVLTALCAPHTGRHTARALKEAAA